MNCFGINPIIVNGKVTFGHNVFCETLKDVEYYKQVTILTVQTGELEENLEAGNSLKDLYTKKSITYKQYIDNLKILCPVLELELISKHISVPEERPI
jgi:hypothetical protein